MTEQNIPQPYDPLAVSHAKQAITAALHEDDDTTAQLVATIVNETGLPGILDAVFVWCATIHARIGLPFGVILTLTYIHPETGEPIPETEADPALIWASHVIQAYVARDKPRFDSLLKDMLDGDPGRLAAQLITMVEHVAAHIRLASLRSTAELS
ncbi:hypothetical protein FXF51_01745 [Nonomuraea sp. PA05]|uniref:hypothetical protein n=1 Tax=Nonomuraea sp. PA05 TaxID=2604466 RepID=UPI0011DB6922|nr:hypothetical protein [Nonomuraea sp. PA05]TYB71185.1 hypothetical protein FXF51_01745 [Nonomuraea sp. PA05]